MQSVERIKIQSRVYAEFKESRNVSLLRSLEKISLPDPIRSTRHHDVCTEGLKTRVNTKKKESSALHATRVIRVVLFATRCCSPITSSSGWEAGLTNAQSLHIFFLNLDSQSASQYLCSASPVRLGWYRVRQVPP